MLLLAFAVPALLLPPGSAVLAPSRASPAVARAALPGMAFGQDRGGKRAAVKRGIKKVYRKIVPKGGEPDNAFLLLARIQVQPGKSAQYQAIAKTVDAAVEASEPGMLHHEVCRPRAEHRPPASQP